MALSTNVKDSLNLALRALNLKISTLTEERRETARIQKMLSLGQFSRPAFEIFDSMKNFDAGTVIKFYRENLSQIQLMLQGAPPARFNANNSYFRSPDAEILYIMVRMLAPRRIVEVGSGNSTLIIHQAITDGGVEVSHVAVDPQPRTQISKLVDKVYHSKWEETEVEGLLSDLGPNDILFIDSSHEVRVANDVVKLFCNSIPSLSSGVVVHVHDVFLPFDYPEPFCTRFPGWGEQYFLQAILSARSHEILWPGYFVQKLRPETHPELPFLKLGVAQSFWFRV
jgi:predicted O-methyltransferase YrrM